MSFIHSLFARPAKAPRPPAASVAEARLREIFEEAASIVVMTGSGLSAGSGLPTHGMAEAKAPAPIRYRHFLVDPAARLEQWRRSLADAATLATASPNKGHVALTALSRRRHLKVVTLTTDGLHARSGLHADDHVEVHGNGSAAVCIRCGQRTPICIHAQTVADGVSPTCERDGDWLKPAHGLFGELPSRSAMLRAEEWAGACDLLVAAGTSLQPGPATQVLEAARQSGAKVVILDLVPPAAGVEPALFVGGDPATLLGKLSS